MDASASKGAPPFGVPSTPHAPPLETTCPQCGADLTTDNVYQRLRVCGLCRHHFVLSAAERIALLTDPGSFQAMDAELRSVDPLAFEGKVAYKQQLVLAQMQTGLRDAVLTGTATIDGQPVALGAFDFRFLGGSMGPVVGEKIARLFEAATSRHLPVVIATASGGARMQEGLFSLMQMPRTVLAAEHHAQAGLPFIALLTYPTTGGVYASFTNRAAVLIAETSTLIGFAGPRVVEQTTGEKLPPDSHTAASALHHGMLDAISDRADLRRQVSSLIGLLMGETAGTHVTEAELELTRDLPLPHESDPALRLPVWEVVELARAPQRPTALDYIKLITDDFFELRGDRSYGDDPAMIVGIARVQNQSLVIIGQERGHGDPDRRGGRALPEGYRKAIRAMRLAGRLGLPLLTLLDTPGAYPGAAAEERGLSPALAECFAEMLYLPVPIVSVVIGEGGSGGALALGVADRLLMLQYAIFGVIAPEGAAAILFRDAGRARDIAPAMHVTPLDLKSMGLIDRIVPEPKGGAQANAKQAAANLRAVILAEFFLLRRLPSLRLIRERQRKYRSFGPYTSV